MPQNSSYDAHERDAKRGFFRPKYIVLGTMCILGCVMLAKPEALSFLQTSLNVGLAKAMGAEEVMGYSNGESTGNTFSSFQKEDGSSGALPSSKVPVRRLIGD
jgi:hypothetical protein